VAGRSEPDGLVFETDFEPARTTGDPRLIERLVANLVTNAVCHNILGGHVSVETRQQALHAILRVQNSGEHLRAEDVPRLFQPFERLERDRRGNGGFGLGLSIVDAIAKAHDATITASPRPEGGLEVAVAFPARDSADVSHSDPAAVTAG
jgi:signal transduction histidine kinase